MMTEPWLKSVGAMLAFVVLVWASAQTWNWVWHWIFQRFRHFSIGRRPNVSRWLAGGVLIQLMAWVATVAFRPSLILGLLGTLLGPSVVVLVAFHHYRSAEKKLKSSALSGLQTLHGLIQAGFSLNAALQMMREGNLESPFVEALRPSLKNFDRGSSFSECLELWGARLHRSELAQGLRLLRAAYERGLSVSPLLEWWIPSLEREIRFEERLEDLRRSARGQAWFTAAVPWLLGGFLWFSQAQVMERFAEHRFFWPLVVGVLLWQGLGLYFMERLGRFQ